MFNIDLGNSLILLVTFVMAGTTILCNSFKIKFLWTLLIGTMYFTTAQAVEIPSGKEFTNSINMKMIKIESGSFMMGCADEGNWDERPVHKVNITQPFYIGETQVTVEQFHQFQSEKISTEEYKPIMAGVSWYDAVEFCEWLSKKEGKPYRLPTEAEWEYVCKLSEDADNKVKNMLSGALEWCHDWYGEYLVEEQEDPVGPRKGSVRVVRGGPIDRESRRYNKEEFVRAANRSAITPVFGHYEDDKNNTFGLHNIGFRVVQAPMPETEPYDLQLPYTQQGIKQENYHLEQGPTADKPYFRKRYLLPAPPETKGYVGREEIDYVGLHPGIRPHNHSPALVVSPNGDLLYVVYTSYSEYEPGVSLMGTRLRFGAEEWDVPDIQFDFPGANCHAPLLWNDNGTLHCFWGNPGIDNAFPFNWTSSDDNGATWSEIKTPYFANKVQRIPEKRQPISNAFRDAEGNMRVPCDGPSSSTLLWSSPDNGQSWYDPTTNDDRKGVVEGGTGKRIAGIHAGIAQLSDGRILAMGRGNNINGYMPKSVSDDLGKTWTYSASRFPGVGGGQRVSLIRLASGRLFLAGDFQTNEGNPPEDIKERGSYVALSEDDGETWHVKKLFGAEPHRNPERLNYHSTIGYSAARQTPDGIIQLITSLNRQALHFSLNEAWILDENANETNDDVLMASSAKEISKVEKYEENYPDGQVRVSWQGGIADDGRFLLHGPETWYYEDGQKKREVTYELGYKVGKETYWYKDGKKQWQWEYNKDGKDIWTQWWLNGQKKSVSEWEDFMANGMALRWDRSGNKISEVEF